MLLTLGPVAIKLGQLLSTRADLIGPEYASALESLQSETPTDDPALIKELIEAELGAPVEELFGTFEPVAFASASIGQVHRATTHDGDHVVVKVQHLGIAPIMHMDLSILLELAQQLERFEDLARYQPVAVATEFRRMLLRELDFGLEARNIKQFSLNFAADTRLSVPNVYEELSAKRVLTMEYMNGTTMRSLSTLHEHNYDLSVIAKAGADLYLEMIFDHGLYHADPHPGNLLLLEQDVIGLLDFGMVGRVSRALRKSLEDILMAYVAEDIAHMADLVLRLGRAPKDIDRASFTTDFGHIVEEVSVQDLNDIDVAEVLNQCMNVVRKFNVVLPVEVSMLVRVIVMLDGTAHGLDPSFHLGALLAPYSQKILINRLSPASQMKRMARMGSDINALTEAFPKGLTELARNMTDGSLDLTLKHAGISTVARYVAHTILISVCILSACLFTALTLGHGSGVVPAMGGLGILVALILATMHASKHP